jgi:SulP family sulfate permease
VLAVLGALLAVPLLGLAHALPLVGAVPAGLPLPRWPAAGDRLAELVLPAFFIALVNYVQSLAVVQWLAARRGEPVDPDRELVALGLCNVGAGLFAGLPVTGGLSRSVVNAEAGAQSQLASLITAELMLGVMVWASAALAWLPLSVLAATIVVAVAPMVDLSALRCAWRVDRADAAGFVATFAAVLLLGVDTGIVAGVLLSLGSWLARAGRPHIAELGRLPGSEHFRNVQRFRVETLPQVLLLRIDESLFFANARRVEEALWQSLAERPDVRRLVLVMSAVNRVDATALTMLERLDTTLAAHGVGLSLAEVKGPVLAVLERGGLAARFAGRLYLSTQEAWRACRGEPTDYVI